MSRIWNLTFFLYGGSLLGAYRNGSVLAWDDDLDFLMSSSDVDKVSAAFEEMENSTISTTMHTDHIFKVFDGEDYISKHRKWSWPFLDIFLYNDEEENGTIYISGDYLVTFIVM